MNRQKLQSSVASELNAAGKLRASDERIKSLEKIIQEQAEQIDRIGRAKWSLPKSPKRAAGGCFIRVVVPDTHGCHAEPKAVAAFLNDLSQLGSDAVREIVMLGDHLDCGGFLAAHHTEHYVAESAVSFEDDVNASNVLLDQIQKASPKAKIEMLEGNHERRIEKWCVTQSLRNSRDAEYLRSCFAVEYKLHLEKRGIALFKQGQFYDGLPVPATIRRGKCFFTHGSRCGKNATAATLADFGGCVVFGHVHRAGSSSGSTIHTGEIVSYCPGCLCRLQPLWNHTQPTGWNNGYGLQIVGKGGEFLHINVPISGGASFLPPLLKVLGVSI